MKTQFPKFQSDEEVERFLIEEELSNYDFSGFRPAKLTLLVGPTKRNSIRNSKARIGRKQKSR